MEVQASHGVACGVTILAYYRGQISLANSDNARVKFSNRLILIYHNYSKFVKSSECNIQKNRNMEGDAFETTHRSLPLSPQSSWSSGSPLEWEHPQAPPSRGQRRPSKVTKPKDLKPVLACHNCRTKKVKVSNQILLEA